MTESYAVERGATDLLHRIGISISENGSARTFTRCDLPIDGMELIAFPRELSHGFDYMTAPLHSSIWKGKANAFLIPENRTAQPCPACNPPVGT